MSYIGNSPNFLLKGSKAVFEYTATAGQTAFTGGDDNSAVLKALDDTIGVYSNGVRLVLTDDYTLNTAGDTVTLTSPAALNDIIVIETFDEIANLGTYTKAEADARYINTSGDITTGTIQVSGSGNNIELGDNNKVTFGGTDLEIYSDGTTGQLAGNITVTGDIIAQSSLQIFRQAAGAASVLLQRSGAAGPWSLAQGNTSTNYFEILEGSNTRLTIKNGGNVGIGTDSPFTKFHAKDTGWSSGAPYGSVSLIEGNNVNDNNWGHLVITDTTTTNGNGGSIRFATGAANALNPFSGIQGTAEGASWGGIGFETRPQSGTATRRMTIDSTGNVGIGTSAPAHKLEVVGTTKAEQYLLDAVAKDISDTAVDVFIYDTRKDSDGGAWRKRTQNTSWYNETLNTATRGARKEFPAVAVIVSEINQFTIYDGDDPDMPMWMVFNAGSGAAAETVIRFGDVGGVVALNASLVVRLTNHYGTTVLNFISEKALTYRDNGVHEFKERKGLADRNTLISEPANYGAPYLVNENANDIAMTVLPNAPIDSATGLPVPTIAVGTNGGVSVIKDDGTVVDITGAANYQKVMRLAFTSDNKIKYTLDFSGNTLPYSRYVRVDAIPSSDFVATSSAHLKGNSLEFYSAIPTVDCELYFLADVNTVANPNLVIGNAYGTKFGLTTQDRNPTTPANGMVAYTTSDYNTGWMNGDIKLATLSDTSTTFDTTELVTNGTFNTDISGWTASGSNNISWSSGTISVARNNSTAYGAYQAISTVYGNQYQVTFDCTAIGSTTTARLYVGSTAESDNLAILGPSSSNTTGTFTGVFTAVGTTTYIHLGAAGTSTGTASFDNVSITLAEQDRSVNGNGLQVFGTVTKSAVATGADLIAYGPFSSANYLQQPYNSDLAYGTGDFCYTLWSKKTGTTHGYIFDRANGDGSQRVTMYYNANSTISAYTNNGPINDIDIPLNSWFHIVLLRLGGMMKVYINGVFMGENSTSTNLSGDTNAGLRLGTRFNGTDALVDGYLSMFRSSATVPSLEQIKKIYEDEKVLFQENAKATLYGSSDAVTALAYDDDTELLHAGTSAGRSVFQGLRRIDNTTDAVGAAISASNGMVAED